MNKDLILIGGGGHCKSLIDVAESVGYSIIGVLDLPELVGNDILSTHVVGTDKDIAAYVDKAVFVIAVGFIKDPSVRISLYNRVKRAGGHLATIVAATAYVSEYASLGEGTVVLHNAFVNAGAKVGDNVILNSFCDIEHDSVIGNHCHISTGAIVNGDCCVGERCFVGSQSVLVNGVVLGNDILVGAGAVVRNNILEKGIYTGNPAKLINNKE